MAQQTAHCISCPLFLPQGSYAFSLFPQHDSGKKTKGRVWRHRIVHASGVEWERHAAKQVGPGQGIWTPHCSAASCCHHHGGCLFSPKSIVNYLRPFFNTNQNLDLRNSVPRGGVLQNKSRSCNLSFASMVFSNGFMAKRKLDNAGLCKAWCSMQLHWLHWPSTGSVALAPKEPNQTVFLHCNSQPGHRHFGKWKGPVNIDTKMTCRAPPRD